MGVSLGLAQRTKPQSESTTVRVLHFAAITTADGELARWQKSTYIGAFCALFPLTPYSLPFFFYTVTLEGICGLW